LKEPGGSGLDEGAYVTSVKKEIRRDEPARALKSE
jgi:hypothetical protein